MDTEIAKRMVIKATENFNKEIAMATIKELLLKIPEYGQLAVQYCIEQDMREGVSVLTMEKKSIKGALISAFNWDETEQGHDFWYNIYKKINE